MDEPMAAMRRQATKQVAACREGAARIAIFRTVFGGGNEKWKVSEDLFFLDKSESRSLAADR